jgi:hypothetical protein
MSLLRSSPFSSPIVVVFVLSVLLANDEVCAIRVPDFTTGIKSKFSMLGPKNRAANNARDEPLDAAYVDEKIVGWDAVNNQPIYDENWDSNKALLEKYNPGSTERKDLPTYKHVPTREEEQNWLYKDSENAELMKEYERRKSIVEAPPAPILQGDSTKAVDEALLGGMSPEERGKMDKSLTPFQRKVMNAMLGGSQVGSDDCNVDAVKAGFLSDRQIRHLREDKAKIGKDSFVHAAGKVSKGAHLQRKLDADDELRQCVEAVVVNDMCDRAAAGAYLNKVLKQAEGMWKKMQNTSIRDHARYEPLNEKAVLARDRWGVAKKCVDLMMPGYWRETVASEKYRKREEGISEKSRVFAAMGGMEKGKVKINGKKIHT